MPVKITELPLHLICHESADHTWSGSWLGVSSQRPSIQQYHILIQEMDGMTYITTHSPPSVLIIILMHTHPTLFVILITCNT